jgi:hypothetical protein
LQIPIQLGPSEPATSDQGHKDQTPEKTTKQRSFHLSGRHIKSKKFSLNAFPLTKSVSFQNHGKGLIKRSESTFFRAAKPSALTASTQVNLDNFLVCIMLYWRKLTELSSDRFSPSR